MGKKAAALLFTLVVWMTGCFPPEAANLENINPKTVNPDTVMSETTTSEMPGTNDWKIVDYTMVNSAWKFRQVCMCDTQTGWALTEENELLFTDSGADQFSFVRKPEGICADTDGFLCAGFPDARTAYLAYFSDADGMLTVEYTGDGGDSWQKTSLDYRGFGDSCDAGSVSLDFVDQKKGYLLYCSTPAAGSMTKILLETADGGKSFAVTADLTDQIAGYPQGISFHGDRGYLAVSYHGENSYLYTTADGGITWADEKTAQALADEEISYIDGYPPVFDSQDSERGFIVLKMVGDRVTYLIFVTANGGSSWSAFGEIPCDSLAGYSPAADGGLLFLDGAGKLYHIFVHLLSHQADQFQGQWNLQITREI